LDPERLRASIGPDTALVCLSHVAYRSGALADMSAINEIVHEAGALVCWDLSHSVGSVPIALEETGSDLAVGCTYKYLNAGPGAPAFLYVRRELQRELRQPIWGWFSQNDQFEMDEPYRPRDDIGRFLVGTPPILGIAAVQEGVEILADAGIERLRAKGVALTDFLVELADLWLVPHGFSLASPRNADRRGSHVSLRHSDAKRISRALIELAQVVPDYRMPERLRLGPAPITSRFVDVFDGLERIRELVSSEGHREIDLDS
jgi:kynureninase